MTLSVKRLTAGYKGRTVLNDISLEIKSGEITALAGINGAGKSTLLSIMAGINSITHPKLIASSEASADGIPLPSIKALERAKLVSFMPQSEWSEWDYSSLEVVLMGRYASSRGNYTIQDTAKAKEALSLAGAAHLANRGIASLSGGEWQRVRLARAVAQDAPFMLLDEPCAGQDMGSLDEMLCVLRNLSHRRGAGVLFTAHDVNTASRYCDFMALLDKDGRLEAGRSEDMMTSENLSRVYGCRVEVAPHPLGGKMAFVLQE